MINKTYRAYCYILEDKWYKNKPFYIGTIIEPDEATALYMAIGDLIGFDNLDQILDISKDYTGKTCLYYKYTCNYPYYDKIIIDNKLFFVEEVAIENTK